MINEHKRLAAACRRFQFEAIKALGVFWLIEKTPWLKIKEPWSIARAIAEQWAGNGW